MLKMKILNCVLVALFFIIQTAAGGGIINCYYGTWANYRNGNGRFQPSDIDARLCTHISYSFFGITNSGQLRVLDDWLDLDSGLANIRKTIELKQKNSNLKVLAAVGGWNEGSTKYSEMAADANKRNLFISSTVDFIHQHGFDGLDLDWEYPAQRGGSAADRANFVVLLRELKAALGKHNLLLSIAVAASQNSAATSYDIPNVAQNVDFINVMTYDFGGSWNSYLSHNAPLYGSDDNNVNAAINYWLQKGAPSHKLILGLPFYGRSFTMSNSQQTQPGSGSSGAGRPGKYTAEGGMLGYNEFCENMSSWTLQWDNNAQVPYAHQDNQWLSFDNERSIELKMNLVNQLKLGGAMVWSIETDDFRGVCGQSYPLLRAINKYLNVVGSSTPSPASSSTTSSSTTTRTTTKATASPSSTKAPVQPNNCSTDGFYVVAGDCTKFYRCHNGIRYNFSCPAGLHFDVRLNVCNYSYAAKCQN